MTMTSYIVNKQLFQALDVVNEVPDFDQIGFKNLEYNQIQVNAFCQSVIDRMMRHIRVPRAHQYVFVQVLKPVIRPAGLWHLDSSLNPVAEYENFLFVTGSNTTEFVMNRMVVDHVDTAAQFHKQIITQEPIIQRLPPNTICRYTGSNVHRRPQISSPEQRLLIRVSNTDVKLTRYGVMK